ncbi:MAG: PAS domain-containing sensor histidine kinase [Chlorobi bacterium]|nr:PAS domain-containing sensor histidine kinase [Chlorobiota bacterium]
MKELEVKLKNILLRLERQSKIKEESADAKFVSLASMVDFPIFILSESGKVTYYNEAVQRIFHSFTNESGYGAILKHFSETASYFSFEEELNDFFSGELKRYTTRDFNLDLITKAGKKEEVNVSLNFFKDNKESLCLMIAFPPEDYNHKAAYFQLSPEIVKEIGKLEEKTQKLVLHSEYLQETNSTKDKFFNIIAHDLRAPFNAILGLADILKNEAGDMSTKDITDMASRIYSASKNSLEMVEDLLDWARLQNNSIEYFPENFLIEDIVLDILFIMKNNALKKKVQITTKLEKKLRVFADKNMIALILRNLLSNAVKFSRAGGQIEIIAETISEEMAKLTIKDNGVGIKKEDIARILKVDEHYSTLGTEKEKGTGLGLVLCNEFVTKNNGELIIKSEFGKGSEISVTIPKKEIKI